MARPCGKAVNDRIYVGGLGGRDWPGTEAPFSYVSTNGKTRYGVQHIKYGLLTTENEYQVGCFYPIEGTIEAARVESIDKEMRRAFVSIMFNGRDTCVNPQQKWIPLQSLLLLKQYTHLDGTPKTQSSSYVPKISSTPPKKDSPSSVRNNPIRGVPITAIAVGTNVVDVYAKLIGLSSDYADPILLAMTHEEMPENLLMLREFHDIDSLTKSLYKQGVMDEDNQGFSCGVEAVNNAGFTVTASDFYQQAAHGVDTDAFMVAERDRGRNHDHFIDQTGGGNNIPPHQMFLTLERLMENQGQKIDTRSWHHIRDDIGTPLFWVGHQWAIIQIPACGGHWVSMEKIMYMGQPAVCLREGRGTVTYDFITSPGGLQLRLPGGVTGTVAGKKRKQR